MAELQQTVEIAEQTERDLERLSGAGLVLGIPSYNNGETIAAVMAAAHDGLARYFPDTQAVIVHADGGSKDGTVERAFEAGNGDRLLQVPFRIYPVDRLSDDLTAMPGRASALQTIFTMARRLGAGACAIVNGSSRGVTAEAVERLVRPVLAQEFDFVAPFYRRHKFDGILGTGILYPMTRALYGKGIRQSGAGEFAASGDFADWCLGQASWSTDVSAVSTDFWLDLQALSGGFRVCQANLGARIREADGAGTAPDLSVILSHLLGALFANMMTHPATWQKVRHSEIVTMLGPPMEVGTEPAAPPLKRMIESYRLGHRDLQGIWGMILPPATLVELKKLSLCAEESFRFQDDIWARTVYDFSLAFRQRTIGRDHVLRALTPLYLGWAASFLGQIQNADAAEVERRVEKLCLAYEAQKPYLISRWRWPDRFNP